MKPLIGKDKVSEQELKDKCCEIRVPLAVKLRASIWLHVTGSSHLYVVAVQGESDYWTFNESQAVAKYNSAK